METTTKDQLQSLNLPKSSENYNDVELTEDELNEAILHAKIKKQGRLNLAEYQKNMFKEPVYPSYTSEELFKEIIKSAEKRIIDFKLDEFNASLIQSLCRYFTNDKAFEFDGKSLHKGIFMYGGVGCGKTTIMQLFRQNQCASYVVLNCRKIANNYLEELSGHRQGNEVPSLNKFKHYYPESFFAGAKFGHERIGICFDDLGTEEIKKHFGNQNNVMSDILLSRYENNQLPKQYTHITSNLSAKDIEDLYGTRLRSRFKEMFNVISFSNESPDRRK